jgi:hypothetical protein
MDNAIKMLAEAINTADDLDSLCCELNGAHDTLEDLSSDWRIEDIVDMSDLPTFGGDEPRDTMNVWSWDATRRIVHSGHSYRIEPRDDFAI